MSEPILDPHTAEGYAKISAQAAQAHDATRDNPEPAKAGGKSKATKVFNWLCMTRHPKIERDRSGRVFVTIDKDSTRKTFAVSSKAFDAWVNKSARATPTVSCVLNQSDLRDVRAAFESEAPEDATTDVRIRADHRSGVVYIDRGDPGWSVVRISADAIDVVPYADCGDVRFRRSDNSRELPSPDLTGEIGDGIELIWKYVNCAEVARPLVLGWLAYALVHPTDPHPHLIFSGPEGSGKSRSARSLKRFTDGDEPVEEPKDRRDLATVVQHNAILAFDNLSSLSVDMQNALCKLTDGTTFSTRALYSNDEAHNIKAMRPAILCGIGDIARASDLLDRSWLIETVAGLKSDRTRYKSDKQLNAMVEADLPRILGALYRLIQAGLKSEREVDEAEIMEMIGKPRRMLDAIVWAVRCLPAAGISPTAFLAAFDASRDHGHQITGDATVFNSLVLELAESGNWKGTAKALRDLLVGQCRQAEDYEALRTLPINPTKITDALKRLAPAFAAKGLYLIPPKDADRPREWKMGPMGAALSAPAGYVNGYDPANWWRDLPSEGEAEVKL